MERWNDLQEAVASVRAQTIRVLETIVVIDYNASLLDRTKRDLRDMIVIPNVGSRGASGARNSGVALSHGEVVAFLDDDAVASANWLESLLRHFVDSDVVGVGGGMIPLWPGCRSAGFRTSSIGRWVRHTMKCQRKPHGYLKYRAVIWLSIGEVFDKFGGFEKISASSARSRPEDTDLYLRAVAAQPKGTWIYEPTGIAGHRVPLKRATFGYLVQCLHERWGKATLATLNGTGESTSAEWLYTHRVLPEGITRGLRDTVRGDVSGGMRSIAIAAGFSFTVAGFLTGRVAETVHRVGPLHARLTPRSVKISQKNRARCRILVRQSAYACRYCAHPACTR